MEAANTGTGAGASSKEESAGDENEHRPESGTATGNSSPDGPAATSKVLDDTANSTPPESSASRPTTDAAVGSNAGTSTNNAATNANAPSADAPNAMPNAPFAANAPPAPARPPAVPLPAAPTPLVPTLISTCLSCSSPAATSAMIPCPNCQAALYCSEVCLENHRDEHFETECRHNIEENQIRAVLESNLNPFCRVLPAGAAVAGDPNSKIARQQRQRALHPSLIPPIHATCTVCRGDATSLDSNYYRLMPSGCQACIGDQEGKIGKERVRGYVHPTCLAREVRRLSRLDMDGYVAPPGGDQDGNGDNGDVQNADQNAAASDNAPEEADEMNLDAAMVKATEEAKKAAAARAALNRLDYRFINAYSHCKTCHHPYKSFLGNALTQLAIWDADARVTDGSVARGDVVWSIARTQHASKLVDTSKILINRYHKHKKQKMAELAKARAEAEGPPNENIEGTNAGGGINDEEKEELWVPKELTQADRIFQEVVDAIGSEADETDLDEYRMSALFNLGQIQRYHRNYEAAIDLVEQCMDVVATTTGRDGFAAKYRDLAAQSLTDLHRALNKQKGIVNDDMGSEAYPDEKPLDVKVRRADGGEDQSQISDLSDRFRNNDNDIDNNQTNQANQANPDEEMSLDDNQAVAIVTVNNVIQSESNEDDDDDDDNREVPMDEILIASDFASVTKNDEHIREYEEARGREPVGSEAYMHLTLTIAQLLAEDARYAEALAQLDMLRDLSTRAFGTDHHLSRAVANHRNKLQNAQHSDWVPELPSLQVLMDKVRATQEEYGVDSIESFRMQIYLIAKHVQSSQVELGIQMVCALRNRAATVFDANHEFNQGHDGVLANIRDQLACANHPWLEKATNTFTGVTIAGSGRSAMVIKDVVKFEWSETDTLMTFVLPIWGGTEDGLIVTFEEEKIKCGGSEDSTFDLLGRIDIESFSWNIDRGVQINCIPGGSAVIFSLVKATPGVMWKLPCRMGIPDSLFRELMGIDDEEEEEGDEEEEEEEEELAAVN